ncbi:hypothetical protein L1049_003739 [Liquidambar formosana]|uniref:3'-5' exonuclease domain-containing protein n=1 Tax=Liquidambar formosana TaxID=63359 RepID=A0AAP0RR48_LIQFO
MSTVSSVSVGGVYITATVTKRDSDVDSDPKDFLSNVENKKKVIGLDTEWALMEDSSGVVKSKIAILQLCDGDQCLIIQLLHLNSIPRSLLNFLRHSDFTFVGIGIKENLAKLEKDYGLGCKNAVELGPWAAKVMQKPHLSGWGVDELADGVASLYLQAKPTSVIFNDWSANYLNKKQVKFATVNVYAYFKIGNKLLGD